MIDVELEVLNQTKNVCKGEGSEKVDPYRD